MHEYTRERRVLPTQGHARCTATYFDDGAVGPVVGVLGGEAGHLVHARGDQQLLEPGHLVARRERELDRLGVRGCHHIQDRDHGRVRPPQKTPAREVLGRARPKKGRRGWSWAGPGQKKAVVGGLGQSKAKKGRRGWSWAEQGQKKAVILVLGRASPLMTCLVGSSCPPHPAFVPTPTNLPFKSISTYRIRR